jgi:hypothetical protein
MITDSTEPVAVYPAGELVNIAACVEPQVREQLFQLAREQERSVSGQIRLMLRRQLALEQRQPTAV